MHCLILITFFSLFAMMLQSPIANAQTQDATRLAMNYALGYAEQQTITASRLTTGKGTITSQNQGSLRVMEYGKKQQNGFFSLAKLAENEPTESALSRSITEPTVQIRGIYLKTKQRIIPNLVQSQKVSGLETKAYIPNIIPSDIERAFAGFSLQEIREIALPNNTDEFVYAITFTAKTDTKRLCSVLEEIPIVVYAEPVFTQKPHQTMTFTPTDPLFSRQYHWTQIHAQEAWARQQGDSALVIAVCDTGVDWEHEDLAENIWTNPGESGRDAQGRDKRSNGIDDDQNGKIDDWHGWDFVGALGEGDLLGGRFREDNDPKPRFANGLVPQELPNHGTHVAGSVAARANNARGGTGSALRCKILPLKCGNDGARIDGIFRAYEAVLYAAQMGAKVIVCSFGGRRSSRFEQDIINTATQLGALVVAAAGNDGKLTDNAEFPASYNNVLAVGASNQADRASSASDFGVLVDVFAPGENILSTATGNEYTDRFSGTSMATPIVAGVAALVKSANPSWTPRQILQQIRATSDNTLLGEPLQSNAQQNAQNRPFGYFGRLNAARALRASLPGLVMQNVSISAATGIIQDAQPVTVRVLVGNILANARNVRISLRSLDGCITAFESAIPLETLDNGGTRTAEFTLHLTPAALAGSGLRTAECALVLLADNYVNYELVSIPYNIRPSNTPEMLVSPLLDFSALPQTAQNMPALLQATALNAGAGMLLVQSMTISGANAQDFSALQPAQTPFNIGAGGGTNSASTIVVRFSPQASSGEASTPTRTATLTLTAVPQNLPPLGAVAGGYEFSSTQAAYTEFSDGASLIFGSGVTDDTEITLGIGFSFNFGGSQHDLITISSNGFCAFAPASSLVQQGSVVTRPLRTFVGAKGYIAVIGADLLFPQSTASTPGSGTSDIRTKTEGTAPNRAFVVQWRNATVKGFPESRINAQLRLYETSQRIEIVYGNCALPQTAGTISLDAGLRGSSVSDIHSRRVSEDIRAGWESSREAVSAEDACEISSVSRPQSGLTFRWQALSTPRLPNLRPISRQVLLRGTIPTATSIRAGITESSNEALLSIFPNPATNDIFLNLTALPSKLFAQNAESVTVSLCTMRGETVFSTTLPNSLNASNSGILSAWRLPIDAEKLPRGMYLVMVTTAHKTLRGLVGIKH